jgi:hypothetical protein
MYNNDNNINNNSNSDRNNNKDTNENKTSKIKKHVTFGKVQIYEFDNEDYDRSPILTTFINCREYADYFMENSERGNIFIKMEMIKEFNQAQVQMKREKMILSRQKKREERTFNIGRMRLKLNCGYQERIVFLQKNSNLAIPLECKFGTRKFEI